MAKLRLLLTNRYLLAAFSGALLACAFPKISWSGAAWIAPGMMLACAFGRNGWERFRIGYTAGFVFYLISLSWLLHIPFRWMGVPVGPAAGLVALSAYLALYPAFWVWLVTTLAANGLRGKQSWAAAAEALEQKGWLGRTGLGLYAAAAWVTLEMIIARLFSGFPWDLLGVSQYKLVPLIQVASVTGIYGVSFLVIWISVTIFVAAVMLQRRPQSRSVWTMEILVPFFSLALVISQGMRAIQNAPPETERRARLALIQPSIPQTLIWDATKGEERFEELLRLSETAMTNKPDLLVWPESAVPALIRQDEAVRNGIVSLARRHGIWMIIGADDFELSKGARRDVRYFNSSFLISPEGELMDTYRKRSLVIFGEYVPLERWIPFIKKLTPIEGGFTPGEKPEQFEMPALGAITSVLICFEDIFPPLGREASQPDTDFLVNLTNNGWFGESAAQWQHAATSVFRAVENRIPLVRCSNNGLTCWVDAYGRMREIFRDAKGSEYGPGFMICDVPLLSPGELRTPTVYHRHGDRFGLACIVLTIIWLPIRQLVQPRASVDQTPRS